MELIAGNVYTGTLPRNRRSPRQYKVERVADGRIAVHYGWFGYRNGKTMNDPWTWSPRGVEEFSLLEFEPTADHGRSPEEGESRSAHPWAM